MHIHTHIHIHTHTHTYTHTGERLAYFEAKAGAEAQGIRLPEEEAEKVDSVIDDVFDGIAFDVEMPSQRGGGVHVLLEGEDD